MSENGSPPRVPTWRETLLAMLSQRMLIALLMGFAAGLPLLLTGSVLQAWLKEGGIKLTDIGLFALVGLPYTLKFLWAPLFDRYALPRVGRRRGWLIVTQLALAGALAALSLAQPTPNHILWIAVASLIVAFFSASQDIVIDAYRRESLSDDELGLGSALYVNGYRIGMLLAGGGGLILADHTSFAFMYQFMAACMAACVIVTWLAPEPPLLKGTPGTLYEAFVLPLRDYIERDGAWLALAFILLYKIGDTMASSMTTPFYLEMGYSKTEIGTVVKLFGFWATIAGGTIGGIIILRIGLARALWWFGAGQLLSTLGFLLLAYAGHNTIALAAVIAFENFTGGMGTTAFVAFMAALTNRRFTATQYALLSSLMGVPRVLLSAPTGWLALTLGWPGFFALCTLLAIPGLLMIRSVTRLEASQPAPK